MKAGARLFVIAGLLIGAALVIFVGPRASSSPDGLEKVAEDQGFAEAAEDHTFAEGPLADYGVRGVEDPNIATGLAGVAGILITFGLGVVLFAAVKAGGRSKSAT
ncbi:MAG: PDGLE domain-containing protein [Actinomycetota bacterium]